MIINEMSGSGGDALPWMFKQDKVGRAGWTRTWGGLVVFGNYPSIDGWRVCDRAARRIYGTARRMGSGRIAESHTRRRSWKMIRHPSHRAILQLRRACQVTLRSALKKSPVVISRSSAVSELS